MENKIRNLTQYRLKVEKNGKSVVDMPGLLCLPGLLAAPKLGMAGMIAAPLLGYNIHLEAEDGTEIDLEDTVQKAADTVAETASSAANTIREEINKLFRSISEEISEETEDESAADTPAGSSPEDAAGVEEIVEELEKHETDDVPVIRVNPDDSGEA